MRLSVIVPVYNTEKHLRACLESIVAEFDTLEMNSCELICVDDGSTDGSVKILEEFQDRFSQNIKIVCKSNGGLSSARNAGLALASGNYIAFIDSDDTISLGMFSEMLELAEKEDCDVVLCDLVKTDEENKEIRILHQLPTYPASFALKEFPMAFAEMGFFACNKIFKKQLFVDAQFTEGIHFEDIDLIPKLILQAKKIGNIKKAFYRYYERQGSISKTHTEKGLNMLRAVESVAEYFKHSRLQNHQDVLRNFIILQGFYSFGAYLAFVKNKAIFSQMFGEMRDLLRNYDITKRDVLQYTRHGNLYIESLGLPKKMFYKSLLSLPPNIVFRFTKAFQK